MSAKKVKVKVKKKKLKIKKLIIALLILILIVLLGINLLNLPIKNIYIVGNKSTARIQMDDTIGLVNFVVDGGSWTNITGGFTPSTVPGGDVDDTLAKIAYTGEIGDAVQYASEPIIIISGGGAPV